jgi:hypothetical protein
MKPKAEMIKKLVECQLSLFAAPLVNNHPELVYYSSENGIWLTEQVPLEYIDFPSE